jgi:hypothetical protein
MDWDRKFQFTKPKFIIIHHDRLYSTNDKTFTVTRTQVSAHYVIADDGSVVQMLLTICVRGMQEEVLGVKTQTLTHHHEG